MEVYKTDAGGHPSVPQLGQVFGKYQPRETDWQTERLLCAEYNLTTSANTLFIVIGPI